MDRRMTYTMKENPETSSLSRKLVTTQIPAHTKLPTAEKITYMLIQWIPDIINVSETTSGVSYYRTFLYAGLKRN